jgi:hypothetical protein
MRRAIPEIDEPLAIASELLAESDRALSVRFGLMMVLLLLQDALNRGEVSFKPGCNLLSG